MMDNMTEEIAKEAKLRELINGRLWKIFRKKKYEKLIAYLGSGANWRMAYDTAKKFKG